MHNRRSMLAVLAASLGAFAATGRDVLDSLCSLGSPQTFSQRYGANPKRYNGGRHRGVTVAAAKRAKAKRRNIRKHGRRSA